jgi:Arc/MetJ-type ribon-helix-helix transcriptional regulator
METEKVCVNLSGAELGAIDVLVAQGLYTSRSDLIRAGVRAVTEQHEPALKRATRHATCFGVMVLTRSYLQKVVQDGKRLKVFVVGICRISDDVSPELAAEAIEEIQVLGSLRAPQPVLARLGDRISRNLDGTSWL